MRSPGYKSLPQINHSHLSSFFKNNAKKTTRPRDSNKTYQVIPEPLNLASIAEDDDNDDPISSKETNGQNGGQFSFGHKAIRKKKTANSAPVVRSPVQHSVSTQPCVQSARTHKTKPKKYGAFISCMMDDDS